MELNIPAAAACLECGYALRGLRTPICPECGRAFDPADASTFQAGKWSRKWRKRAEPPSGWHVYGMIILTVSALYGISLPSGQDPPGFTVPIGCYVIFLGPFFVVAVVIDYFIRLNAINADRARAKQDRGLRSRRRNRRFVVAPLCIVMIISMFATAWPLRARFYFSHVAFERVAQQCIASDKSISRGQWIGLFHIRNVEIVDGEVYFETGSGTWDPVGFVFDTKPPGIRSYFREIVPNWYTYED